MSALHYKTTEKNGMMLITIGGSLDVVTADQLDIQLSADIEKGARRIVINLEKLDYIAHAGLEIIANADNKLKSQGGGVILSSLPVKIEKIVALLNYTNRFMTFPSDESALQSFEPR